MTLPMAMQLFLVVLGGRIEGCHIELHDVRFVVDTSIEDTLPQLRQHERLHQRLLCQTMTHR
jgi:hypothetical protein